MDTPTDWVSGIPAGWRRDPVSGTLMRVPRRNRERAEIKELRSSVQALQTEVEALRRAVAQLAERCTKHGI